LGDESSDRLKYQMELAHGVLRNLLLVNGGAIVALFTFIGDTDRAYEPRGIWWAFTCFAAALVATLVASILGYFPQGSGRQENYRAGTTWELFAILFIGLVLAGFCAGAACALNALMLE
jgi:hypothetical protein